MRYEIYHSDGKGNNKGAWTRTRKDSAIRLADRIEMTPGDTVKVCRDLGPYPGDCKWIHRRTA
jgi:hypothetical protein